MVPGGHFITPGFFFVCLFVCLFVFIFALILFCFGGGFFNQSTKRLMYNVV